MINHMPLLKRGLCLLRLPSPQGRPKGFAFRHTPRCDHWSPITAYSGPGPSPTMGLKLRPVLMLAVVSFLATAVSCANTQHAQPVGPSPSSLASVSANQSPTSVSSRAKEWLNRCITGNWDWKQFGTGPNDAPTNTFVRYGIVQGFRKVLEPFGAVKSMQYLDQRSFVSDEGHHRTVYRYRVQLERGNLIYEFAMDADGYVGGVLVRTNALGFTFWR